MNDFVEHLLEPLVDIATAYPQVTVADARVGLWAFFRIRASDEEVAQTLPASSRVADRKPRPPLVELTFEEKRLLLEVWQTYRDVFSLHEALHMWRIITNYPLEPEMALRILKAEGVKIVETF